MPEALVKFDRAGSASAGTYISDIEVIQRDSQRGKFQFNSDRNQAGHLRASRVKKSWSLEEAGNARSIISILQDSSATRNAQTGEKLLDWVSIFQEITTAISGDKGKVNLSSILEVISIIKMIPENVPTGIAFDEEETILDWSSKNTCLVASFVGDGVVAYSYRKDGPFVPGLESFRVEDSVLPADFQENLS